jgi:hypothetical protein
LISQKTNKLGDEIAQDVNNIEVKIKQGKSEHQTFEALLKDAMLTLESKFDRAMEHKPIVRTVKQKIDYPRI